MGKSDPDRDSAQYNGGIIYFSISINKVCLTVCESYEGNLVLYSSFNEKP